MRKMKMLLCLVTLAAIAASVAACNTTEGLGRDIEAGGRNLKESAQEHNN